MSDKKLVNVTQEKSPIGRKSYQRKTLIGLGLNKIGRSRDYHSSNTRSVF
jgi:large subunit ribosomal protein L30